MTEVNAVKRLHSLKDKLNLCIAWKAIKIVFD